MAQILLAEDDPSLASVLVRWLQKEGHQVNHLADGAEAIRFLDFADFDLLILDIELPGASGLEILKAYRSKGGKTMAIFLTARSSVEDKLQGFETGADDYLSKPFHAKELIMRVNALLRRSSETVDLDAQFKNLGLQLLPTRSAVRKLDSNSEVSLTQREYALLDYLLRRLDQIVPSERLLNSLWTDEEGATPEALAACITRLRKKIDLPGTESMIKNVHGRGYQIVSKK
jgi:DNA-binding response OmpR family regulator